jgi:hypothetical protein
VTPGQGVGQPDGRLTDRVDLNDPGNEWAERAQFERRLSAGQVDVQEIVFIILLMTTVFPWTARTCVSRANGENAAKIPFTAIRKRPPMETVGDDSGSALLWVHYFPCLAKLLLFGSSRVRTLSP